MGAAGRECASDRGWTPPGFGGSERRDELMNPRAMGDFIVRIADAFGLDRPHVVAPDIGTSSTLFAASAHPGRFRSLVIGSGGAAVPITVTGVLKDWVESTDLEPLSRASAVARSSRSHSAPSTDTHRPTRSARTTWCAMTEIGSPTPSPMPRPTASSQPLLGDLLPRHPNSGSYRSGKRRSGCAAGQCRVPERSAPPQPCRLHRRRGPLLLGGEARMCTHHWSPEWWDETATTT